MRICTYYYSDAKDKTSINMSEAFWELSAIQQLDVLRGIAYDAQHVYAVHLDRCSGGRNPKKYQIFLTE